jgi:hypothetical protein
MLRSLKNLVNLKYSIYNNNQLISLKEIINLEIVYYKKIKSS